MEEKSAIGGTKRRRNAVEMAELKNTMPRSTRAISALSRRVTRVAKKLKQAVPVHMIATTLGIFASSTTATLYDTASGIGQGDDYNARYGSAIRLRRLVFRGTIRPGSTSTAPATVRLTVFRGESGLAFAANMTGSFNPVVTGTSTRLLWDKFFLIPATPGTVGFPVNMNFSVKLNHPQKFSGTGTGTQTGESIYVIMQSDTVAGTTAPVVTGVLEIYFDPM